jgi:hypothetical protein
MSTLLVCISHRYRYLYSILTKLTVLSFQERQDLLKGNENDYEMGLDGDDAWEDVEDADVMLSIPPPGEEGLFLSHAGGESTLQQIFEDSMSKRYRDLSDKCTLLMFSQETARLSNTTRSCGAPNAAMESPVTRSCRCFSFVEVPRPLHFTS